MVRIRELFARYREQIAYVFFGGLTTFVNTVAYFVMERAGMDTVPATALAQVLAVLFAYVTNKRYVFRSRTRGLTELLREMGSFFACRAVSFFLDIGIMWVTVDVWGWPGLLMKLISNVVIIVVNYLASKLLIFNKGKGADR